MNDFIRHLVVGTKNVISKQLVNRNRIILPQLHINLGLMKQFVHALDEDGACFRYICSEYFNKGYKFYRSDFKTQFKLIN